MTEQTLDLNDAEKLMSIPLIFVCDFVYNKMVSKEAKKVDLNIPFKDCKFTISVKEVEKVPNHVEETLRAIDTTIAHIKKTDGDKEAIDALVKEKKALMDKYNIEY